MIRCLPITTIALTLVASARAGELHWAFVPPKRPAPPVVERADWPINAIDRFVLARLEAERLAPSPEADRATLIRRVTLDLTGLPPTIDELDAFLADDSPEAYERLVDRLLDSPRYGEHMAVAWLDLARYSDSHGYGADTHRTMWPWRDWLIAALNANMPFDRFTIEQLAGDQLPEPTHQQLVATAFNRNQPIQVESGAVEEEFRAESGADRLQTTATAWLGLTIGCARCHDHKTDPISQREFYQLFAFFNTTPDKGVPSVYGDAESHRGNFPPLLETPEAGAGSTIMIMREMDKPRDTFVLDRGLHDRPIGDALTPAVPASLGALPATDGRPTRLDLARWLVSRDNPLTARVTVNRYWQHFFGVGLVESTDDLGVTGDRPSHRELLDWLAVEFVDSGWRVKHVHKLIVMSATYRQSSRHTPSLIDRDPTNQRLARGAAFRLPAESIRDSALFAGGLLVEKIGGPPVRPYQPDGLWAEANYLSERTYTHDPPPNLYRRSVYTHWRRMIPPPTMSVLDAPSRDVCIARRQPTNTPLQALALLNDTTYVEAARKLAERMMRDGGDDPIGLAFRICQSRLPDPAERDTLKTVYESRLAEYRADADAARALLSTGDTPADASLDPAQLAALTIVARIVLNLDETITRR